MVRHHPKNSITWISSVAIQSFHRDCASSLILSTAEMARALYLATFSLAIFVCLYASPAQSLPDAIRKESRDQRVEETTFERGYPADVDLEASDDVCGYDEEEPPELRSGIET